jgi:hypothetical protein
MLPLAIILVFWKQIALENSCIWGSGLLLLLADHIKKNDMIMITVLAV